MKAKKQAGVALGLAALMVAVVPANAGWKLIAATKPLVVEGMTLTPASDWNRASAKPSKRGISLTHDGFNLDALEIFSGVPAGDPLYRERSKKRNPMPKFDAGMLLPDLADYFERSFRAKYQITDFAAEAVTPTTFVGQKGIAVRYRYSLPGEGLVRQGTVRLSIVGGKLYAANFFAPRLHYFPSRIDEIETMMDGARL